MTNYSFYLIVDDSLCLPQAMPLAVNNVLDCGITCVQLRMKNSPEEMIINTAYALKEITTSQNIPLIINDHVTIAKQIDADGVHLGQQDMPIVEARNYLGENKIIGLSIENHLQAISCQYYPVNYFGVGPIFPTTTKIDAAKPIGLAHLSDIAKTLTKPVVALGGIHTENVNSILETGVAGIALASYVLASPDQRLAAKTISALLSMRNNS